MTAATPAARARETEGRVLDLVIRYGHPAVVVDSPPGAGKTDLVASVAAMACREAGLRVVVVAPRAEQTYEIMRRLVTDWPRMPIYTVLARDRVLPADLATVVPRITAQQLAATQGPCLIVSTVAKLAISTEHLSGQQVDLVICDEAYQVPYHDFLPLYAISRQFLFVGDPGQLPPLVETAIAPFEAARYKVHWPVPKELEQRIRDVRRIHLPATWRLPQDTVEVVQPSFYEHMRFGSAVTAESRRLAFSVLGLGTPVDRALDMLTTGASMVAVLLPPARIPAGVVDEEVAALAAQVEQRILERGGEWVGERVLTPDDLGVVDPHVASGAAIRRHLRRRRIANVLVETPEIWQGLQRPVMVVKHPLSGGGTYDAFDLEPGRLCVMLSRHQLGCVIVGRDGITEGLERHRHDVGARPTGADDMEWRGRLAHERLWQLLETRHRIVRVGTRESGRNNGRR